MSCEISIHDMIIHIVHLCSLGCLILFNVVYVSEIVRRHVTPYHIGLLTHGFEAIETVCIFPCLSMAFHGIPWWTFVRESPGRNPLGSCSQLRRRNEAACDFSGTRVPLCSGTLIVFFYIFFLKIWQFIHIYPLVLVDCIVD
jgi:hypothetical protein